MALADTGAVGRRGSSLGLVFGELRRWPWIPIIVLGGFLILAAFANWLAPYSATGMSLTGRLQPPGSVVAGKLYLLGTDQLGRDILTRVIYGARTSVTVAATGLLFGGGLGLLIGIVAGYRGGWIDVVLMRLTDSFMAVPNLLIALVFVMTLGPGLQTIVVALAIVTWSRFSRVIRSEVLLLKERDFVQQAIVANARPFRIMLVHIFPNVMNTFIVLCSLQVSQIILTEATLSFLGAGVPPPTPTWGNMVSDGREYITSAWWICFFPGIALTLVVFSFNMLGDWLRTRFDPRLRQA